MKTNLLIGPKSFYSNVFKVVVPIIIQGTIDNLISILDNIMISVLGTKHMVAVSISNQVLLLPYFCFLGITVGAGVLGSQYFGKRDNDNFRNILRIKILFVLIIYFLMHILLYFYGSDIVVLYLKYGNNEIQANEDILTYAHEYLRYSLWGQIPLALSFCYSTTLRETFHTTIPMKASLVALSINFVLNYIFINGNFGFPALGITGAAIGTIIARSCYVLIMISWIYINRSQVPYMCNLFKNISISFELIKKTIITSLPLMMNEILWCFAIFLQTICYSTKGFEVVSALSVNNSIVNLFNVINFSLGGTISIITGRLLGANHIYKGKMTAYRIILFSIFMSIFISVIFYFTSPLILRIYNLDTNVYNLVFKLMHISIIFFPMASFLFLTYFTFRTGGNVIITFLFDSVSATFIVVPITFLLCNFTSYDVVEIAIWINIVNLCRAIVGYNLLKHFNWAKRLV